MILGPTPKRRRGCDWRCEEADSVVPAPPKPSRMSPTLTMLTLVGAHPLVELHVTAALHRCGMKVRSITQRDLIHTVLDGPAMLAIELSGSSTQDRESCRIAMRSSCGEARLIALVHPRFSRSEMLELFLRGLRGLVPLASDFDQQLVSAVHSVNQGYEWMPSAVRESFQEVRDTLLRTQLSPPESLTGREYQVLLMVLRGLTNKQIGAALGITSRTAKFHVANLLAKLDCRSRTNLHVACSRLLSGSSVSCFARSSDQPPRPSLSGAR